MRETVIADVTWLRILLAEVAGKYLRAASLVVHEIVVDIAEPVVEMLLAALVRLRGQVEVLRIEALGVVDDERSAFERDVLDYALPMEGAEVVVNIIAGDVEDLGDVVLADMACVGENACVLAHYRFKDSVVADMRLPPLEDIVGGDQDAEFRCILHLFGDSDVASPFQDAEGRAD